MVKKKNKKTLKKKVKSSPAAMPAPEAEFDIVKAVLLLFAWIYVPAGTFVPVTRIPTTMSALGSSVLASKFSASFVIAGAGAAGVLAVITTLCQETPPC